MKKLANLPAMALLFIATLAFATSCSKSASTPVDEFVGMIENFSSKIENASTEAEIDEIAQSGDIDMKKFNDSTYELTSADKDKIKGAVKGLFDVMMKKVGEFTGQEIPASAVEMAVTMFNAKVDNCKTLGDLATMTSIM